MPNDSSAKYYQNTLDIAKEARNRYQDLHEEEKNKKGQYRRERYKNLPEKEKQRLVEYRKNIIKYEKKIKMLHK